MRHYHVHTKPRAYFFADLKITASWLITYLAGHPEWRAKAAAEVDSLPTSPILGSPSISLLSLSACLSTIPLEAWENETPILDSIIRETTHVAQPHTAMRRNLGPELYINNKLIQATGAYLIYPFSDVHLDPEVYTNPWKFNPSRKEPNHVPFSYVGWGGGMVSASWPVTFINLLNFLGKTTCLGTRLAKVELKLMTAMFVLGFSHSVIDRSGAPSNPLPVPNWNDILPCRPLIGSFGLKYQRTALAL